MKMAGGWIVAFGAAFAISATPLMAQDNRGQDPRREAYSQRMEQIQQQRAQREQAVRERISQQRTRETQPPQARPQVDPRQSGDDARQRAAEAARQRQEQTSQARQAREEAIRAKAAQDQQRQQDMKQRIDDMREQQQSRTNEERNRLEELRKARENRSQTESRTERPGVSDEAQKRADAEREKREAIQAQRDKAQEDRAGRLEEVRKEQEAKRAEQQARIEEARKRAEDAKQGRDKPEPGATPSVEAADPRDSRQQKIDELRKAQEEKRAEQQSRIEEAKKRAEEAKQGRTPSEHGQTPAAEASDPRSDRQQKIDELRKEQEAKRAEQQNKLEERKSEVEATREEQRARLEELRKQREKRGQEQTGRPDDAVAQPKPGETPTGDKAEAAQERIEKIRAEREAQRNEMKQKLEERREAESAKTAELRAKREEAIKQQQQRVEEMKASRQARAEEQKVSQEDRSKAIAAIREGRRDDSNLQKIRQTSDKEALRETITELRTQGVSKDEIKRTYLESRKSGGDVSTALSSLSGERQVAMVGANIPQAAKNFDLSLKSRELSRRDIADRLGDVKVSPRVELTENQLDAFRKGRVPDGISRPRDWDRMGRPLRDELRHWGTNYDRDWHRGNDRWDDRWRRKDYWDRFDDRRDRDVFNISINIGGAFLPPVVSPGYYPDYASFSWNYWDGRRYYDHSYATTAFLNIGHVRYGGFDGVSVSGRYYSYGYGWIDGCIDYGGARIWVPGFWAPTTVRECTNIPVWIEPVYETIWTGCCWETVQVDGGYFRDYGYTECHNVTRYQWIPGHFQYSYVS